MVLAARPLNAPEESGQGANLNGKSFATGIHMRCRETETLGTLRMGKPPSGDYQIVYLTDGPPGAGLVPSNTVAIATVQGDGRTTFEFDADFLYTAWDVEEIVKAADLEQDGFNRFKWDYGK